MRCPTCRGTRQARQHGPFGHPGPLERCWVCDGSGEVPDSPPPAAQDGIGDPFAAPGPPEVKVGASQALSAIPTEQLAWEFAQAEVAVMTARADLARLEDRRARFGAELLRREPAGTKQLLEDGTVVEWVEVPSRRSIDQSAIEDHAETLATIDLAPWDEPQPARRRYPTLRQIEKAERRLRQLGLEPDVLIIAPPPVMAVRVATEE